MVTAVRSTLSRLKEPIPLVAMTTAGAYGRGVMNQSWYCDQTPSEAGTDIRLWYDTLPSAAVITK